MEIKYNTECTNCIKADVCSYKSKFKHIKEDILKVPYGDGYTYKENPEPFIIKISCEYYFSKNKEIIMREPKIF